MAPTGSRRSSGRAVQSRHRRPRESPGLEILELLLAKEARAEYSDPHIPRLPIGRRHKLDLTSMALTEAALRAFDAAVLVTDHSAFPYELIHRAVPLIIDTRNAFRSRGLQGAHVVHRTMEALNARGKALKGARVLVLGAAYKRDTDDPRESPGLEILELLLAKDARAEYSDPHIPRLPIGRRHKLDLASVPLTDDSLRGFDAAVLVTDHAAFPYELIHRSVPLIVDTRNAFRSRGLQGSHIVSA